MDDVNAVGSSERTDGFAVLPMSGGGAVIISMHPAGLPNLTVAEALARYRTWGATAVLSLLTEPELLALNLSTLPSLCKTQHMQWWHAPIEDMGEPDEGFERWWQANQGAVHGLFNDGHALVLHCWSGYGRSGTVAARILIERGMAPQAALAFVRQHRPGAVETAGQQDYVLALSSGSR